MTPRDALKRQADQVAHYSKINPNIGAMVAKKTNLNGLDLDAEYDVIVINRHIPRGGAIESMLNIDFGGH